MGSDMTLLKSSNTFSTHYVHYVKLCVWESTYWLSALFYMTASPDRFMLFNHNADLP